MTDNFDLNKRFRVIREIVDLNQADFAGKLGYKQSTISKIENNKTPVTDDIINEIHSVFQISKVWIKTGKGSVYHFDPNDDESLIEYLKNTFSLTDRDITFIFKFLGTEPLNREILYKLFDDNSLK